MANKSAKLLDANAVNFSEMDNHWISLNLGDEKFVMDVDALIELSFRCAAFLAQVESKEESTLTQCECYSANSTVH